ncbi:MAG TPA: UvrD-helicase domain-containing protein [Planctomycetota bacterium]
MKKRRAAAPAVLSMTAIECLKGLNPEQRTAVETTEGPVLVLAGAGSGKTSVITRRIAYLVARGVPASQILAVTFTNKAAREMRERVGKLVGPAVAKELTVRTFHSFCVRLLREHGAALGLPPNFGICDEGDQLTAVKNALRELRIPETSCHPNAALSKISLFKNKCVSPAKAREMVVDDWDELIARAYEGYEGSLRRSRIVDFDDLLVLALKLLEEHEPIRTMLQERFRFLLVDEYQDTNGPQYEILRRLAGTRRNLCVVGDDDQSIYGWRGADVKKILNFGQDFKGAKVVRLETNYRSTQAILDAANAVIRNNRARHEKALRTNAGPGEPVRVFETNDEEHESQFVCDEILRDVRAGRAKLGDYAILFRTAIQPRTFEMRLRSGRIPYELVGGMSFFDRKEVRDVLAYLRLAANPADEPSFLRVINVPARGIGKTTIDKAVEFATKEGISTPLAFERAPGLSADALGSLTRFRQTLSALPPRAKEVGLTQAIRELLVGVSYSKELDRCYDDPITKQARWQAVEEIVNYAENYSRRAPAPTLEGFLEDVALSSQPETEEEGPKDVVTLMTLHAAKGLEFTRVYLVGCEENILPHARSIAEDTVEEERRLMYVGITRAKRYLTITRAKSRAKYGQRVSCLPSRFLFELKGETVPFALPQAAPKEKPAAPAAAPAAAKAPRRGRRT